MISVFGAGFVGGKFVEDFSDTYPESRDSNASLYPEVLYLIGTTTNYNPKDGKVFLDVETNLVKFLHVLRESHLRHGDELVFNLISTWFVYSGKQVPASEDSSCDPKGFYSITARAREQLLISYCETFGVKYRILRLANIIGIDDKNASLKKNALQFIVKELSLGRDVTIYNKTSIRDYMDIRDCVTAVRLVLDKGAYNDIFNISNGLGLRVRRLIDHAWMASGFIGKINEMDVPAFHSQVQVSAMCLDNRKIRKLGYIQKYPIKETVEELVKYYKNMEIHG